MMFGFSVSQLSLETAFGSQGWWTFALKMRRLRHALL